MWGLATRLHSRISELKSMIATIFQGNSIKVLWCYSSIPRKEDEQHTQTHEKCSNYRQWGLHATKWTWYEGLHDGKHANAKPQAINANVKGQRSKGNFINLDDFL
jgi:hypothetical protein